MRSEIFRDAQPRDTARIVGTHFRIAEDCPKSLFFESGVQLSSQKLTRGNSACKYDGIRFRGLKSADGQPQKSVRHPAEQFCSSRERIFPDTVSLSFLFFKFPISLKICVSIPERLA